MAIAEFFNKYKTIKINNSNRRERKFNNIDWLFSGHRKTYQKITKWSVVAATESK